MIPALTTHTLRQLPAVAATTNATRITATTIKEVAMYAVAWAMLGFVPGIAAVIGSDAIGLQANVNGSKVLVAVMAIFALAGTSYELAKRLHRR